MQGTFLNVYMYFIYILYMHCGYSNNCEVCVVVCSPNDIFDNSDHDLSRYQI